jgi:hypothetical protein
MTWTSLSLVICAQLTGRGATIRRSIAAAVILYLPSLLVKEQALAAFAGVSVIACLATVHRTGSATYRRGLWVATAAAGVECSWRRTGRSIRSARRSARR